VTDAGSTRVEPFVLRAVSELQSVSKTLNLRVYPPRRVSLGLSFCVLLPHTRMVFFDGLFSPQSVILVRRRKDREKFLLTSLVRPHNQFLINVVVHVISTRTYTQIYIYIYI
jgi:hypothetical protein